MPFLSLLNGSHREIDRELASVLSPCRQFHHLADGRPLSGLLKGGKVRLKALSEIVGRHQIVNRLAQHLGRRVTEHPFGRRVPEDRPAFAVDHDQGVHRTGAHRSESCLPLPQRILELFVRSDVNHGGPNTRHHPPVVPNQHIVNLKSQVAAVAANVFAQERSKSLLPGHLSLEGLPAFRLCAWQNEFKYGSAEHCAGLNPQKFALGPVDPPHNPLLVQLVVGYRPLLEKIPESLLALDQVGQSPRQPQGLELLSQRKGQVAQTRDVAILLCCRTLRLLFSGALRTSLCHWHSLSNPKVRGSLESTSSQRATFVRAGEKTFAAGVPVDKLANLVTLGRTPPTGSVRAGRNNSVSLSTTNISRQRPEYKRNL